VRVSRKCPGELLFSSLRPSRQQASMRHFDRIDRARSVGTNHHNLSLFRGPHHRFPLPGAVLSFLPPISPRRGRALASGALFCPRWGAWCPCHCPCSALCLPARLSNSNGPGLTGAVRSSGLWMNREQDDPGIQPKDPSPTTTSGTIVPKHSVPRYNVLISILGCHDDLPQKITFARNARIRRLRCADLLPRSPLQPLDHDQRRPLGRSHQAVSQDIEANFTCKACSCPRGQ
jgi:hypothetical protein